MLLGAEEDLFVRPATVIDRWARADPDLMGQPGPGEKVIDDRGHALLQDFVGPTTRFAPVAGCLVASVC